MVFNNLNDLEIIRLRNHRWLSCEKGYGRVSFGFSLWSYRRWNWFLFHYCFGVCSCCFFFLGKFSWNLLLNRRIGRLGFLFENIFFILIKKLLVILLFMDYFLVWLVGEIVCLLWIFLLFLEKCFLLIGINYLSQYLCYTIKKKRFTIFLWKIWRYVFWHEGW